MTSILGINAYHADSSACLVQDGRVVAAAEEERFRRSKHWAGFPSEAIRYCLDAGGLELDELEHVAINGNPRANIWKRVAFTLRNRPSLSLIADRLKNQRHRSSVADELATAFPETRFDGKVHRVEHHQAHLASTFLVSPFDEAVAVSVDGFGDFASAGWGVGRDNAVSVDERVFFPHSLGFFYLALTQFLGFWSYGDEYKVMGLAPYGEPHYLEAMREIVQVKDDGRFTLNTAYFRHDKEKIDYQWSGGTPTLGALFSNKLEDLLGPARSSQDPLEQHHKDMARSVQAAYEEALFSLLTRLHERYGIPNLAIAGGCAMNSVANGKIREQTPFEKVYVQPAAADAGGAMGAAMQVWHELLKTANAQGGESSPLAGLGDHGRFIMDHAYWGPRFDNNQIADLLEKRQEELAEQGCRVERVDDEDSLCSRTARAVSEGKVVGWFQGRMEWGPRALGNRSILGDPCRADMKDILNHKIKRRESFRPFAPSVLREAVVDWFVQDDDVPFMMKVFAIRPERREQIPAVTHVDGSGRLQSVYRETNPRYYALISAFRELTGVPLVLNTSFNENEPVVCRPEEALDCFLRTNMDLLVLEDYMVWRIV